MTVKPPAADLLACATVASETFFEDRQLQTAPPMAKPNYSGEKRRKELEKQRKKEEKKRRKTENASAPEAEKSADPLPSAGA